MPVARWLWKMVVSPLVVHVETSVNATKRTIHEKQVSFMKILQVPKGFLRGLACVWGGLLFWLGVVAAIPLHVHPVS